MRHSVRYRTTGPAVARLGVVRRVARARGATARAPSRASQAQRQTLAVALADTALVDRCTEDRYVRRTVEPAGEPRGPYRLDYVSKRRSGAYADVRDDAPAFT